VRFPVVVLDSFGDAIEVPLHLSGVGSPSSHSDIVGSNAFHHSSEWKL